MYLFFYCTITVWYGLATYICRQWNRARLNVKQQRDHVISARARLYREHPLALYIFFVLRGYLWRISMVFVYTGVFSEYNIIIHYNSVKNTWYDFFKHWYRRFCWWRCADVAACADVRCPMCTSAELYIWPYLIWNFAPIFGQQISVLDPPPYIGLFGLSWSELSSMGEFGEWKGGRLGLRHFLSRTDRNMTT